MPNKLSYQEVKDYIEQFNYELLSQEYKNANSILSMRCPNGHIHKTTLGNFKRGQRCAKCKNCNIKYDLKYVKEFIESRSCILLDNEYINCKEKLTIICPNDHTWKCSFDNFKRGRNCPHCRRISKGEDKIKEILNIYNINYTQQYKIDDCRYIYPLPFDFYLNDLNIIIEYDGIQHFEEVKNWGGFEKLKLTQEKDCIKENYCLQNNITLIRIAYWDFDNIEEILINKLNLK
jgi:very-short-patch-repair endonuclease